MDVQIVEEERDSKKEVSVEKLRKRKYVTEVVENPSETIDVSVSDVRLYPGWYYTFSNSNRGKFVVCNAPMERDVWDLWEAIDFGVVPDDSVSRYYGGEFLWEEVNGSGGVYAAPTGFVTVVVEQNGVECEFLVTELLELDDAVKKYQEVSTLIEDSERVTVDDSLTLYGDYQKYKFMGIGRIASITAGIALLVGTVSAPLAPLPMVLTSTFLILLGLFTPTDRYVSSINIPSNSDQLLGVEYRGEPVSVTSADEQYASVEVEAKADGTVRLDWVEQNVEWVVEGDSGVPSSDVIEEFDLRDDAVTALVQRTTPATDGGLTSECGEWVIIETTEI